MIGGGAVACELAQAFARLGSTVTVVHRNAQLLSKESPDAAALIRDALIADGVDVRCGVTAVEAESEDGRSGTLVLTDGSHVPFDRLVMAVGRSARSAGLERMRPESNSTSWGTSWSTHGCARATSASPPQET